jgi:SNF2 family DNA or RNA helicase
MVPRVGLFATVRNRRGLTTSVEPFDGPTGRLHLVQIEYKDDQFPRDERLIWELEPASRLLEPTALPNVGSGDPMPAEDFDALLRATRWSAATPFLDPDGSGPLERLPVASPFHGAVQVDDFQLVPLLKALRMPRVNLLLADDVGLGKTVEAGLILSELLLRRRLQRVLVLTPASLRLQWRDEMWDKFSLPFDLVDRAQTHALRRRLGMDANPWRSFSRIIASYHYLRQEDVLEQFLAACRTPEGSPHLPWDLLIVDECHNLMPSAFGDDSDLCRMLRLLAPQFEHRLFLSATPHNGHTRCFTGLLEILDPVRFSQTDQLREAERGRVQQVVIRRLKREINARTNPPKFCTRLAPQALVLSLTPQ